MVFVRDADDDDNNNNNNNDNGQNDYTYMAAVLQRWRTRVWRITSLKGTESGDQADATDQARLATTMEQ
ncbi:hypothetical protein RRF57_001309 [Xylaria bambusicola]|uniref:Uncharacterized protein n=1 Tax=Xylaria bambusicola TaxID=326684 RepID=A0AAN7UC75_9PEZI